MVSGVLHMVEVLSKLSVKRQLEKDKLKRKGGKRHARVFTETECKEATSPLSASHSG
jgi:hypothetical protein